jgi:hypothetical protein
MKKVFLKASIGGWWGVLYVIAASNNFVGKKI